MGPSAHRGWGWGTELVNAPAHLFFSGLLPVPAASGEGTDYAPRDSAAAPVAQLVKNLPAMWETWGASLSWEDPLEMEIATHLYLNKLNGDRWTSLVTQMVKNLPATRETWVQPLGWEDSPGEGKGYPLQDSWASLVAQLVKNLPAMQQHCLVTEVLCCCCCF